MDLSTQYVLMCEKSQEIQELWKYSSRNSGDWYFNKKLNKVYVVSDIEQDDNICVWLPRQDQLQEMISDKFPSDIEKIKEFNNFIFQPPILKTKEEVSEEALISFREAWRNNNKLLFILTGDNDIELKCIPSVAETMEQLWLFFVMKEKYNKFWDGDKEEWGVITGK